VEWTLIYSCTNCNFTPLNEALSQGALDHNEHICTTSMEQPQNLRSLFATAKAEKRALESRPDTNTDQYRNGVNATIAKFEECGRLVAVLSLFSSNEPLEDIATGDLP
jgi:hypothetical protein